MSHSKLRSSYRYISWFNELTHQDLALAGGKNISLGELITNLPDVNVPDGFAVLTTTYDDFLEFNNLTEFVHDSIDNLPEDFVELKRIGMSLRTKISNGIMPPRTKAKILRCYKELSRKYLDNNGKPQEYTDVAIRSSATVEDLPEASFAGQQETYLNIRGGEQVIIAIKNCFASLFTNRALSYRSKMNLAPEDVKISVAVQKMVRSDLASAGVAFSLDPESGFRNSIVINGNYGLGESVVGGIVKPDEIMVFKPTLKNEYPSIIDTKLGNKDIKIVYGDNPNEKVTQVATTKTEQNSLCISKQHILQLAKSVLDIERYYSILFGKNTPVDVEWAVDGLSNTLFIVQARPETIHSNKKSSVLETTTVQHDSDNPSDILVEGISVGDGVGFGEVKILHTLDGRTGSFSVDNFKKGDVLVTDMTNPDWEPIMKIAGAIVTNRGGRTCHAAIIAREIGVAAVVGCQNATQLLKNNDTVTVSCGEGSVGFVYRGKVPFKTETIDMSTLPRTKTNIMLNVGNPDSCMKFWNYPHKGVGLARLEFIINNYAQVHPLALLHPEKVKNPEVSAKINSLVREYPSAIEYYISKIAFGVSRIAATFYPEPVIVRFSDFKTNEYKQLLGGENFEGEEDNPMLGFRGCSRYYSKEFKKAFGLECVAIKRVRETFGLRNVIVMLPFCRTLEECDKVLKVMSEFGLKRGYYGLQVYLMCEIPSNVLLMDDFAKKVDGISFGTNDLTSLVLGLDRDGERIQYLFDERNPAVKKMISMAIRSAHNNGIKVGLCGQAPSDHPDFAEFLVEEGIDSISVTPDSLLKTINVVHNCETL